MLTPEELKQWRPPEFPSGGSEVKTSLRLEDDLAASWSARAPLSSPGIFCTSMIVPALPGLIAVPVWDAALSDGLPLPLEEFGLAALGWLNTFGCLCAELELRRLPNLEVLEMERLS